MLNRSLLILSLLSSFVLRAQDSTFLGKNSKLDSVNLEFKSIDSHFLAIRKGFNDYDSLVVALEEARFAVPDSLPLAVDFAPDYSDSIIIDRIAQIYSPNLPLRFDSKIRGFIDYFTIRKRGYTRKMMKRSKIYFPIMEEVLEKYKMPPSIKYLAIVESGLDPKIRSWAGAMGLWQFMPATGKAYALDYDYYIDERLDPYKSTEAACRYLRQLYNMFGDWELALGAYNCGPGNMRKAIRRSGYKKSFAEVYDYLPKETRSYVPQFMAVNYVMRHLDEHNIYIEEWEYDQLPEHRMYAINQYLDLEKFSECTGICTEDIVKLNPEIKRDAISTDWKNYQLRLPESFFRFSEDSVKSILSYSSSKGKEKLNYAYRNPGAIDLSGSDEMVHRVRSGESLGSIANRYNVSVRNIKSWNRMRGSTIYPGQKLKILTKKKSKTKAPSVEKTLARTTIKKEIVPEGEMKVHVVKSGDVLGAIATKYDVSVAQLKSWNNLRTSRIDVGQKIKVYHPSKQEKKKTLTTTTKDFSGVKTKNYTVVSGDALYTIAVKNGMSVQDLKDLNHLTSSNLKPGQVLKVTADKGVVKQEKVNLVAYTGKVHVVKSGESLWTISRQYDKLSVDDLKKLNNLSSNSIDVGDKLRLE